MASLGLDLGDDDMLNDGNDVRARHPRPGCQEFTVSCTVVAICTQSTPLSGSCSAPHARAPATVGVRGTVDATPGTTWWNGAYTRRSLHARSPAPRRVLAANLNPTDGAVSRRRVLHHRARSMPAARAAGGVHPVWARGGHVTVTWPRLYFVKNVLLICVFTEQTLFGGLKRTRGPVHLDSFRAKTILFPTYQDLAERATAELDGNCRLLKCLTRVT